MMWEVTYVNDLDKGTLWQSASDWSKVLPDLFAPSPHISGLTVEGGAASRQFKMANGAGTLVVIAKHLRRQPGNEETVQVTLQARGSLVGEQSWKTIADSLDAGREAIVTAFAGLTSSHAHAVWERYE